jgi:hypothetical protein
MKNDRKLIKLAKSHSLEAIASPMLRAGTAKRAAACP